LQHDILQVCERACRGRCAPADGWAWAESLSASRPLRIEPGSAPKPPPVRALQEQPPVRYAGTYLPGALEPQRPLALPLRLRLRLLLG
jgi:hypothetical protein